jgi:hypothetical protein
MPLDELYPDVFHTVLDFLELDDIARLSSMNHTIHDMCTEYVPMVSEFTLNTLQTLHCLHIEQPYRVPTSSGYITPLPIPCTKVDKSSVEHRYCRIHMDHHVCWDCGTMRAELEQSAACVNNGCCHKYICRLEDGGCPPLQCWSCLSYYDVLSLYKYTGKEKDLLCHECVQEHQVADVFVPCVTWYGISEEEAERRYG